MRHLLSALFVVLATDAGPDIAEEKPLLPDPAGRHDCLAGLCVGTRGTSFPNKVVVISEDKYTRSAEVCAGQVTMILACRSWTSYGTVASDMLPGTWVQVSPTSDDKIASNTAKKIVDVLSQLGWRISNYEKESLTALWVKPDVKDYRATTFHVSDEINPTKTFCIASMHEQRSKLCQDKIRQGL